MNLSISDLAPVALDLALGVLILLVISFDAFAKTPRAKGSIGYLVAFGLAALFVGSYVAPPEDGVAFLGTYSADAWALYFKRLLFAIGAVSALGSVDHVRRVTPRRQGEYYALMLFSLLGMTLLAGARDLILLVVCFELMGIPLFVLAAIEKRELSGARGHYPAEASLKFFLVGVVSTPLSLFGMSLVVGMSHTTDLALLTQAEWSPLMNLGLVLILAGMGFKIGLVPFHMWVPDTYQGAPTPFVAFLSSAPKVAGFAALSRVYLYGAGPWAEHWVPIVVVLCLAALVLGNFWALAQANTKRLLAYSGIGHIGYLLMAFVGGDAFSAGMLLFYLVAYAFTNLGAFLVVEAVSTEGSADQVADFDGLARRSPWLGLAMLLFLLSLAGIPFVAGFWAKLYVFIAAWQSGYSWLVVIGALLAVVALFYYMQVARAMYMVEPAPLATASPQAGGVSAGSGGPRENRLSVPPALAAAVLLCLAGVVGLGAYPQPLLEAAGAAAESFLGPAAPASELTARRPGVAAAEP